MEIAKTFDNYYSNKKFDPSKPFILLDKYKLADDSGAWAKQKNVLLSCGLAALLFLAVLTIPLIFFYNFLVDYMENNTLVYILMLFSGICVMLFFFTKTLSVFLRIEAEISDIVSLSPKEDGLRASLIYSLRAWLNARYELKLTDDHVISLLVDERTPFEGKKYKLVFSDNKREIVDLVVDNSCPSGCCDKENVEIFELSPDTKTFTR